MKLLNKATQLLLRIVVGISGEIQVVFHVVDVIPHGVQWNVGLLVTLHHVL